MPLKIQPQRYQRNRILSLNGMVSENEKLTAEKQPCHATLMLMLKNNYFFVLNFLERIFQVCYQLIGFYFLFIYLVFFWALYEKTPAVWFQCGTHFFQFYYYLYILVLGDSKKYIRKFSVFTVDFVYILHKYAHKVFRRTIMFVLAQMSIAFKFIVFILIH